VTFKHLAVVLGLKIININYVLSMYILLEVLVTFICACMRKWLMPNLEEN